MIPLKGGSVPKPQDRQGFGLWGGTERTGEIGRMQTPVTVRQKSNNKVVEAEWKIS